MAKTVSVELTKEELFHLENDLISYIWHIKESVFGDYNFGTNIDEVDQITPEQEDRLRAYGYYSRKALLDRLKQIEKDNFSENTICG
jgi:hypothetical protein